MFIRKPFIPIYSLLLSQRLCCAIIVLFPSIFICFELLNIAHWTCPLHQLAGVDCAGCGMTRATINVLKGNLFTALRYHPLAPFMFAAWAVAAISLLLPEALHKNLLFYTEIIEKKTGISQFFIAFFFLYGTLRLVIQSYYQFFTN